MNQEEADQDAADEVSEEADSRGEVMRSEENDEMVMISCPHRFLAELQRPVELFNLLQKLVPGC